MTTNPTHVLLIPCEMITFEEAAEIKAHLIERLPSWVDPVLLGGARGSATLIPYERPDHNNLSQYLAALSEPTIILGEPT